MIMFTKHTAIILISLIILPFLHAGIFDDHGGEGNARVGGGKKSDSSKTMNSKKKSSEKSESSEVLKTSENLKTPETIKTSRSSETSETSETRELTVPVINTQKNELTKEITLAQDTDIYAGDKIVETLPKGSKVTLVEKKKDFSLVKIDKTINDYNHFWLETKKLPEPSAE